MTRAFKGKAAKRAHRPDDELGPFSLGEYERDIRWACDRNGLKAVGLRFTPHGVRHAAPSADVYHKRLHRDGVKARGLWKSTERSGRYGKLESMLRMIDG